MAGGQEGTKAHGRVCWASGPGSRTGNCPYLWGSVYPGPGLPWCLGSATREEPCAQPGLAGPGLGEGVAPEALREGEHGWAPHPGKDSLAPWGLGTHCSPRHHPSDTPLTAIWAWPSGTPIHPRDPGLAQGDRAGRSWRLAGHSRSPAGVDQLPSHRQASLGPPRPPIPTEAWQKKGPLIARGGLRREGCYSSPLRCAPPGPPRARSSGLCFSWLEMCLAPLASAGRGPQRVPLLPLGAGPCAKQGLLRAHLLRSCGEEGEDVRRSSGSAKWNPPPPALPAMLGPHQPCCHWRWVIWVA